MAAPFQGAAQFIQAVASVLSTGLQRIDSEGRLAEGFVALADGERHGSGDEERQRGHGEQQRDRFLANINRMIQRSRRPGPWICAVYERQLVQIWPRSGSQKPRR